MTDNEYAQRVDADAVYGRVREPGWGGCENRHERSEDVARAERDDRSRA